MSTNNTYHYNAADIQRYLNGSMNAHEMHNIEKAALNDPLLADAIDGYKNANQTLTAKHLNEINSLLQNKKEGIVTRLQPAKKQWWQWFAAASLIGLLAFSAWFFLQKKNDEKSHIVQAASEKTVASSTKPDSTLSAIEEKKVEQSSEKKESVKIKKQDIKNDFEEPKITMPQNDVAASLLPEKNYQTEIAKAEAPVDSKELALPQAQENKPIMIRGISSANKNDNAKSFFSGTVTDQNNNPVPAASIVISGTNRGTSSDAEGNFAIAKLTGDSIKNVSISAVGYEPQVATLLAGKVAGISLEKANANLNEVVVVGYGSRKKSTAIGAVPNAKPKIQVSTIGPYPEGGWQYLYETLYKNLNIDKQKANKTLHITFNIEKGRATEFKVVQSPDSVIANRAIQIIQNGPKWKNYQPVKNSEIKIMVE